MKRLIFLALTCGLCQWAAAQEPVAIAADSLTTQDEAGELAPIDTVAIPIRIGSISAALIDSVAAGHAVPDTTLAIALPENILTLKPEDTVNEGFATQRLFNDEMRSGSPAVVLDYVEAAYRQHFSGAADETDRFADITFAVGSWDMLRLVNDTTPCSLTLINGRTYRITWQDLAEMEFPVQYDRLMGGSRAEIEDRLIDRLSRSTAQPGSTLPDSLTVAEAAGNDCYTVKGDVYGISQVNRDYYLQADEAGLARLVFDSIHPAQSLSNLFVCGIRGQQVPMAITIPKHEYGVRDTVQTTVAALSEVCGADGCVAYWGTELQTDSCLRGSVFLYNIALGYDHVLRVECDPRLIGTDRLVLACRMSLFIPTTNVKDLSVTIGPKEAIQEESHE